jgi:hypothetical protein
MMRKILALIALCLLTISCTEDVKFNDPGFQGLKDDYFWRASDARAYINDGKLTIEAYAPYEVLTLGTSSTNLGKYNLGTTNTNNFASYTSTFDGIELEYGTIPTPGPVLSATIQNGGTGYGNASSVAVTGGSGSGMSVTINVDSTGKVIAFTIMSRGNGYMTGDLVTVTGGNLNCKLRIQNVQNSNGEIEITEFDNVKMTISGKFKFNAVNSNNNPLGGEVVNFQSGEFHNIQIYPSI